MTEWDASKSKRISIFDDYSVHENEIDDEGMTDEQIRCEIRDNYIQNATVLVLLCGKNTKRRKHIDWEIHAAMYNSDTNPKMGILVINLPDVHQAMIVGNKEEGDLVSPNLDWESLDKSISSLELLNPYLPQRIITNIARENVTISVVNWSEIENNPTKVKELIDIAFNRKDKNIYDHSEPLRRKNS